MKITYYGQSCFAIETKGKAGLMNSRGEIVIPIKQYKSIKNYSEGTVQLKKNGEWYLADTLGTVLMNGQSYKEMYPMKGGIVLLKDKKDHVEPVCCSKIVHTPNLCEYNKQINIAHVRTRFATTPL